MKSIEKKYKGRLTKIFVVCVMFLFTGMAMAANPTNLVAEWNGNGKTGANSQPNKFGWDCTNLNLADWGEANAGGVRYVDMGADSYLPNGRLLYVRWDGVGGTNSSSVYSFPVNLDAYKSYTFSIKYTRHSNSTTNFVVGVNASKDNSGEMLATGSFAPSTQSFKVASFRIVPTQTKTYYITIGASAGGMLGAITDLSVVEMTPTLESEKTSLRINYFTPQQSTKIYPNGTDNEITFGTPTGVVVIPSSLPSTGGTVTISSPENVNTSGNITVTQGNDILQIPIVSDYPADFFPTTSVDTLTTDGAWCWFADPRAIYHKGTKEQTYFSWVTKEGHIEVASYNHETKKYNQYRIWEKFQEDDHANPSLLIRKDGRIIIFVAAHFGDKIHRFITTNPEDITSWSADYQFSNTVTYPYPFQVGDSICVFYRGGSDWHPRLSVSTDNGETFDDGRLFISGGGQRPYTRYCQGADGSIHVAVTTGHPRNESANKIHYCRFKDNKVYRADGTLIKDVTSEPVDLNQLEVVYNGTSYGKGWIWDITLEPATGNPIMVYASFPSDTDHRYHYGRWNGTSWDNVQITEAGRWFPQTPVGASEPEPNYSGGIILDYDDPSVVYLSKEVNGVFEIFKFTTPDKGQNWSAKALTWNTPSHLVNVRPIVPRHHKDGFFDIVWMRGTYEYYGSQRYNTALVFPSGTLSADLTAIEINPSSVEIIVGEERQLSVNYFPSFAKNKDVTWSSSDNNIVAVEDDVIKGIANGTATIKATAANGASSTCVVFVKKVDLLTNVFFDFGTIDSPVAQGAVKVTESTLLTDSYGWLTAVNSRNRSNNDSELRDFNMFSSSAIFKVYLENGAYKVTVKQGDYDFGHDQMNLKVNGVQKLSNVTNAKGGIEINTFDLVVDKKYAEFEFSDGGGSDANWVVNSIMIEKEELSGIESSASSSLLNDPKTSVRIYDLWGKLILEKNLGNRNIHQLFNSLNLVEGVYITSLRLSNQSETLKYIHHPLSK